uniref:Vacuolar fusion protein MON1 homolog n=1 Tax=Culicoides sonorensis TaxID=179676 RepID=A0A336MLY6_CULSO
MGDKNESNTDDVVVPGTSNAPLLITNEIEELTEEILSSNKTNLHQKSLTGKILQIKQESLEEKTIGPDEQGSGDDIVGGNNSDNGSEMTKSSSFCSAVDEVGAINNFPDDADDFMHDPEFLSKQLHVFIISSAGKPIYTLHGNEDKLATLFGVMQAIVSVVQSNDDDNLKAIHAAGVRFVFLVKNPIILVAVSRTKKSVPQLQMLLHDVFNQIVSTLTLSHLTKVYDKWKNFDLRRLLSGSERLIHHLLLTDVKTKGISNNSFIFLTHSIRILPLQSGVRDSIVSAIQNNCSKIKNLVFAIMIAKSKLIALVRMKKYVIHPADLRIIFNLIDSTENFKYSESWTPICLPKFDPNGYMHAHVSYLADDCEACLLLMSVEQDHSVFSELSESKRKITEKLRRSNCLEAINESINNKGINLKAIGIPEIRHFLYRCKSSAQLVCSEITAPYNTAENFERLENTYFELHHRIHNSGRPLKLIYEAREKEILLVWVTQGYELFATFEPLIDKITVINLVNKLLKWIKKEEDYLFIMNAPSF